eukprot:5774652-Alexandrium_andersonii.AAC.1
MSPARPRGAHAHASARQPLRGLHRAGGGLHRGAPARARGLCHETQGRPRLPRDGRALRCGGLR